MSHLLRERRRLLLCPCRLRLRGEKLLTQLSDAPARAATVAGLLEQQPRGKALWQAELDEVTSVTGSLAESEAMSGVSSLQVGRRRGLGNVPIL